MSDTYYGDASAVVGVVPPAAVNISSSTNATPIVVTTSSAHGLNEGVTVLVQGHLVNTAANGFWKAHIVDSTHVALLNDDGTNSVGSGVGGASGTTQSLSLPGFAIPADGDDFSASAFNPANEANGDIGAFLWRKIGWQWDLYSGGSGNIHSGATVAVNGSISANSGGLIAAGSGAQIFVGNGASFVVAPTATVTMEAPFIRSGSSARAPYRYTTVADSTPQTLSNANDVHRIPSTLTSNTTLNIAAGTEIGDWYYFFRTGSDSHTCTVHDSTGGSSFVFTASNNGWLHLVWDGSAWLAIGASSIFSIY